MGFSNFFRILCIHAGHILGCASQLVSGLEPTPLRLLRIFHIYLDNFIDCPLTGMQPKVFLIFVSYTPILSILVCEPPGTRMIAQALPGLSSRNHSNHGSGEEPVEPVEPEIQIMIKLYHEMLVSFKFVTLPH